MQAESAGHTNPATRVNIAIDRIGAFGETVLHRVAGNIEVEICINQRTQHDRFNPAVQHDFAIIAIAGIPVGVGQTPVRVEVGDYVTIDVDERSEPQAVTGGDAGDLVEVHLVVGIEVGREDDGLPLLHIQKVRAPSIRGG